MLPSVCSWPAEGALAPVAEELLEHVKSNRLRLSNVNLHKCIRIISVHKNIQIMIPLKDTRLS